MARACSYEQGCVIRKCTNHVAHQKNKKNEFKSHVKYLKTLS
jgi:hypothetical protein